MSNNKNSKIQKWLKRLISEEIIAHDLYVGSVLVCKADQRRMIQDMFNHIAEDELDEHAKCLIDWAVANGYDVPFKYKDYEKCAAESTVKQFNALKSGEDADYYVDQALKAEVDAIASYEEALRLEDVPEDLLPLILRNYYDELQHVDDLDSLKLACEAGLDYVYTS